jgi:putative photosynthetic complex assembly protein 2
MLEYGLPAAFALFVWWFGTGLILYLDGLPRHTFRWSMRFATVILAASLYGVWATKNDTSIAGACIAFAFAIAIWGWHELSFLLGEITGPRRTPCPPNAQGWARFRYAVEALLHHEIALAVTLVVVAALAWGGENQTATLTFLTLWIMRLSTKLNIFLGVPNHTEEFLPQQLAYLQTYFRRARMNLLFPVSVTLATAVFVMMVDRVGAADTPAHEAYALTLVAALLALGILEHWFLVLPVSASAAWSMILRLRGDEPPANTATRTAVYVSSDASTLHDGSEHALQSWGTELAPECDPHVLRDLLTALAQGAYGDVECVFGVAKAGSGWVHFNVEQGNPSLSAFRPRRHEQPCVVAVGRKLDRVRLRAAFSACAVPATGGVCR